MIEIFDLYAADENSDSREHTKRPGDGHQSICRILVIQRKLNPMTGRLKEPLVYKPKSNDPGVA